LYYKHVLEEGFKQAPKVLGAGGTHSRGHYGQDSRGVSEPPLSTGGDPGQLHVLDGSLPGVFKSLEEGAQALLQKLLACAGQLPPADLSGAAGVTKIHQIITSPSWTTCKEAWTWKLTWPTHRIGINAACMGTTSWGYLLSATIACSKIRWEEIETRQASKMNTHSQP
jgi:hypothetical protein